MGSLRASPVGGPQQRGRGHRVRGSHSGVPARGTPPGGIATTACLEQSPLLQVIRLLINESRPILTREQKRPNAYHLSSASRRPSPAAARALRRRQSLKTRRKADAALPPPSGSGGGPSATRRAEDQVPRGRRRTKRHEGGGAAFEREHSLRTRPVSVCALSRRTSALTSPQGGGREGGKAREKERWRGERNGARGRGGGGGGGAITKNTLCQRRSSTLLMARTLHAYDFHLTGVTCLLCLFGLFIHALPRSDVGGCNGIKILFCFVGIWKT